MTFAIPPRGKIALFRRALLSWYATHRRSFSWRKPSRNAYQLLIAELLLRKTDALKVSRVYESFLGKYPSPVELARAKMSALLREIRGLGIADRARLLKALGNELVRNHGGKVPSGFQDLVRLPGIGRYTAIAVLCFGFGKRVPLVDTNVIRILSRVFSVSSAKPRPRDDELWQFAGVLVSPRRQVAFNRALLDLGAMICTTRSPKCTRCPLNTICG